MDGCFTGLLVIILLGPMLEDAREFEIVEHAVLVDGGLAEHLVHLQQPGSVEMVYSEHHEKDWLFSHVTVATPGRRGCRTYVLLLLSESFFTPNM